MILASSASEHARLVVGSCQQLVECAGSGVCGEAQFVAQMERTSIGSHHFGHVVACHLRPCEQLEGAHHGVVAHGSALYDDGFAQCIVASELQYFVEAVLHHGVGEPRRDVGHRGSFA